VTNSVFAHQDQALYQEKAFIESLVAGPFHTTGYPDQDSRHFYFFDIEQTPEFMTSG
jgi:hypothetical protein